MTKAEIARKVEQNANLHPTKAYRAVDTVLETIKAELRDHGTLEVSGFGAFTVRFKEKRPARNQLTGEVAIVSERFVVRFKPSLLFKKAVDGGAVKVIGGERHLKDVEYFNRGGKNGW